MVTTIKVPTLVYRISVIYSHDACAFALIINQSVKIYFTATLTIS